MEGHGTKQSTLYICSTLPVHLVLSCQWYPGPPGLGSTGNAVQQCEVFCLVP